MWSSGFFKFACAVLLGGGLAGCTDALTTYRFNKHAIQHLFCKTCGIQPFARAKGPDGTDMVAVNVRCLEGVEPGELNPRQVDGRSF